MTSLSENFEREKLIKTRFFKYRDQGLFLVFSPVGGGGAPRKMDFNRRW
jgi:hypothetical protein